jgi:hypothetical protein|tara:strand:+ start:99 stop:614 length:516 start_codon:yes stop_codon:yes gene_type:complete
MIRLGPVMPGATLVLALASAGFTPPSVLASRRDLLRGAAAAFAGTGASIVTTGAVSTAAAAAPPKPGQRASCGDIESCREAGERRFNELEEARGPVVRLGEGVSYRETQRGGGAVEAESGDILDITYSVFTGSGYYMYGVPSREPGKQDLLETYRLQLGQAQAHLPCLDFS